MATNSGPENVNSFNFENLRKFKQLVPDESQRYILIGLSLTLGDYKARKEMPEESFNNYRRQTTTRIKLATYIARQQEEILAQLKSKPPQEVIESLKKTPLEDNIHESEISKRLGKLDLPELGKRIEIRLSKSNPGLYHDYQKNPTDRTLNQIFLEEAETIIHALAYEIKR